MRPARNSLVLLSVFVLAAVVVLGALARISEALAAVAAATLIALYVLARATRHRRSRVAAPPATRDARTAEGRARGRSAEKRSEPDRIGTMKGPFY